MLLAQRWSTAVVNIPIVLYDLEKSNVIYNQIVSYFGFVHIINVVLTLSIMTQKPFELESSGLYQKMQNTLANICIVFGVYCSFCYPFMAHICMKFSTCNDVLPFRHLETHFISSTADIVSQAYPMPSCPSSYVVVCRLSNLFQSG